MPNSSVLLELEWTLRECAVAHKASHSLTGEFAAAEGRPAYRAPVRPRTAAVAA
jgi:hypothetical protein